MSRRDLFWLTVVLYVAVLVVSWLGAPGRVPLHFDGSGTADRFGSRTSAGLFFTAVGVFLAVLLGGLAAYSHRLPSWLFNVQNKAWWTATPEREGRFRARLREDFFVIGSLTMLLMSALVWQSFRAVDRQPPKLGVGATVALVLFLVLLTAQILVMVFRRYRREEA